MNEKSQLKVQFSKEGDISSGEVYTHFKHRNLKSGEFHSLKPYINKNIDSWLQDLCDWHDKLCVVGKDNIKDWWLSNASRLIAWMPPIYQPYLFSVALINYCQANNIKEIKIVEGNEELYRILNEQADVEVIGNFYKHYSNLILLKQFLRAFKYILLFSIRVFHNFLSSSKKLENKKLVIYSHLLELKIFEHSEDHFFGNIFVDFKKNKSDQLWIYFTGIRKKKEHIEYKEKMNNEGKDIVFLEDFLRFKDLLNFIGSIFRFFKETLDFDKKYPTPVIGGVSSREFSKIHYRSQLLSTPPFVELTVKSSLENIFSKMTTERILFPFEDKPLERAIVTSVPPSTETIGFGHAVHNKGHLYFRKDELLVGAPPRPTKIACTGENAKTWLLNNSAISKDKFIVIGSKRYLEKSNREVEEVKDILILVGQWYEVEMLANLVEEDPTIFEGFTVSIRLYPFGYFSEQASGVRRLFRFVPSLKVLEGSLLDQLNECDVCLFSSTSAAFEAMLLGRLCISVDTHHIVPLDPIEGKGNIDSLKLLTTAAQLKDRLDEIRSYSKDDYQSVVTEQRAFAQGVYSKSTPERLELLFN
jgi:hypothetical protein